MSLRTRIFGGLTAAAVAAWLATGGLLHLLATGVVRTDCDEPLGVAAALLRDEGNPACAIQGARTLRGRALLRRIAAEASHPRARLLAHVGMVYAPVESDEPDQDEAPRGADGPRPRPDTQDATNATTPPSVAAPSSTPAPRDDSREDVPPADLTTGPRAPRPVHAQRPAQRDLPARVQRLRDRIRWREERAAPDLAAVLAALAQPDLDPALRQELFEALHDAPGAVEIALQASALPWLREEATLRLGAVDAAWAAMATRTAHVRAERARACGSEVDVPPTLPAAEAPEPEPPWSPAEQVAGVLLGEDTERADVARVELHAATAWLRATNAQGRAARLADLVAPRGAWPGRRCEAGDLAAALGGVGTPASAALLAELLGEATGVEVRVGIHAEAHGILLLVGGDARLLAHGGPIARATMPTEEVAPGEDAPIGRTVLLPRGAGAVLAIDERLADDAHPVDEAARAALTAHTRAVWPGHAPSEPMTAGAATTAP